MTLMAGFDFLLEIHPSVLWRFLKSQHIESGTGIGAVPLNPPFEIRAEIPDLPPELDIPISGTSYVIVTGLDLTLEGWTGVRITMQFNGSSIVSGNPDHLTIFGLSGKITLLAQLVLTEPAPFKKAVGLDLAGAETTVQYSAESQRNLRTALRNLEPVAVVLREESPRITVADIEFAAAAVANQQLANLATNLPNLGFEFDVRPGFDGSLESDVTGRPQFERLELRNIGNQAVGLFGSFLVADHFRGDPNLKEITAIPGGDDVSVSISPEASHRFIFCPGLAKGKKLSSVSELPPSCGSGQALAADGVTSLSDRFEPGVLVVSGNLVQTAGCYTASVGFECRLRFEFASDGTLVRSDSGTVQFGQTNVVVDDAIDCILLDVAFDFAADIAWGKGITDIIRDAMRSSFVSLATKIMVLVPSTLNVPTQLPLRFNHFEISTEGMTLAGRFNLNIPDSTPATLSVKGEVSPAALPEQIPRGNMHIEELGCIDGDFPVTELLFKERGLFWYETYLIPRPHDVQLSLETYQGGQWSAWPIAGSATLPVFGSGVATLDSTNCSYLFPPVKGSSVSQAVHIDYVTKGNSIHVSNRPKEGNFVAALRVSLSNPYGIALDALKFFGFTGNGIIIGGDYEILIAECIRHILDAASRFVVYTEVPRWVPVDHPRPDEVLTLVQQMASIRNPEVSRMLPHVRLLHQGTLNRAVSSLHDQSTVTIDPEIALDFPQPLSSAPA